MPGPVQDRQWRGADLVVSQLGTVRTTGGAGCLARAHPGPSSSCSWGSTGSCARCQLCVTPLLRGQAATPPETTECRGPFSSLAASSALKIPEHWSCAASDTSSSLLKDTQSLVGGEARAHKSTFLSSSCALTGQSQPGTTDPG